MIVPSGPAFSNEVYSTATGKDSKMLVLTRRKEQSIVINDDIEITVVGVCGKKVRLGITAPRSIPVHRREVYDIIKSIGVAEKK